MTIGYVGPDGQSLTQDEWEVLFERRSEDEADVSWWRWLTRVGDVEVSTVWVGVSPGPIWETQVFGGPLAGRQWRHPNRDAALAGHDQAVALARDAQEARR